MFEAEEKKHLLSVCLSQASTEYNGLRVAADYTVDFIVDRVNLGTLHSAPSLLAEAATGLALSKEFIECGDVVREVEVKRVDGGSPTLRFYGTIERKRARCPPCIHNSFTVRLSDLRRVYRDFARRLSKRLCPIAVHRLAVYTLDPSSGSYRFRFFIADPSRHTAAYKLAGFFAAHGEELCSSREVAIVVSTGRVSDDIVKVLATVGLKVIVSFHHPLLSGLIEAEHQEVTLVLQDPVTGELRAFTAPWRVT